MSAARIYRMDRRLGHLEQELNLFRTEVRHEFTVMRQEMADGLAAVRQEMHELNDRTNQKIDDLAERTTREFALWRAGFAGEIRNLGQFIIGQVKIMLDHRFGTAWPGLNRSNNSPSITDSMP